MFLYPGKNMKRLFPMALVLGLLMSACELFTNALRNSLAHIDNMDQNVNISHFLCQYSSQVQYPDPSRYHFSDRQIPDGYWNTAYLVLRDLKEIKKLLAEKPSRVGNPIYRTEQIKQPLLILWKF